MTADWTLIGVLEDVCSTLWTGVRQGIIVVAIQFVGVLPIVGAAI